MKEVLHFILENYRLIIEICVAILWIVLLIVKKKPVNSIIEILDHACLLAIQDAEKTELKGKEKLTYAIELVCRWLQDRYPKLDFKRYLPLIENTIEIILSTPQKKGENDGK